MITDDVYEGFYDAWRDAEKWATESNKDIKDAKEIWPTVARIRSRIQLRAQRNVSTSSVQYHLNKLLQEELIRQDYMGWAGVYYPVGLLFTELDRAQL
jgi:predicted transcriptional regulator